LKWPFFYLKKKHFKLSLSEILLTHTQIKRKKR